MRACILSVLANADADADAADDLAIPLVDADTAEWTFLTSVALDPRTLTDMLKWADADKWVATALAEIDDHVWNGTWVLTQFPSHGCLR